MGSLLKSADCVLPVENDALLQIYNKIESLPLNQRIKTSLSHSTGKPGKAFDGMNNIVANLLANMTRYYSSILTKIRLTR